MQREPDSDAPYEPAWGADGWPRLTEHGLDEGDLSLIRSMQELTPFERLRSLEDFVNAVGSAERVERIPTD